MNSLPITTRVRRPRISWAVPAEQSYGSIDIVFEAIGAATRAGLSAAFARTVPASIPAGGVNKAPAMGVGHAGLPRT
jgi:hypothetical protein